MSANGNGYGKFTGFRGVCANLDMSRRFIVSCPGRQGYFTMYGRMRAAREKAGLSCEDLAKKLGVHRTSVWRWERDDIRTIDRDVIEAWAKACQVDITWLEYGGASGNVKLDWASAKYGVPVKEQFHFYTA